MKEKKTEKLHHWLCDYYEIIIKTVCYWFQSRQKQKWDIIKYIEIGSQIMVNWIQQRCKGESLLLSINAARTKGYVFAKTQTLILPCLADKN